MNEQRFGVSDVLLQRLESHLPGKVSDAGATAKDNRLFLQAVLLRVRTGSPWRDLPPAFGHWVLARLGERQKSSCWWMCSAIWFGFCCCRGKRII